MKVKKARVLSGMRSTGMMHLGHYHGALKNWVKLQDQYECFFFAADWHALTTDYANPEKIAQNTFDMIIDWLACGIDPKKATIFIQSQVSEHAELHVLLSMITPLGWLERVPTYKDQQTKIKDKDLSNYGFLGYPVLQAADVLAYKADYVPVGEDQLPHLELIREITRRFNDLYGQAPEDMEQKGDVFDKWRHRKQQDHIERFNDFCKRYQQTGDKAALAEGYQWIESQGGLEMEEKSCLKGFLRGGARIILPEPKPLLTEIPSFPGLDGQKMSKSYRNTIELRESEESIKQKINTMPTDPARIKRSDPGNPEKCPVWKLHKIYSDDKIKDWVQAGCKEAKIGCLECKKPLIEKIIQEQEPIRQKALEFVKNPGLVHSIIEEGRKKARRIASQTLAEIREAMGIVYKRG